MDDNIIKKSTKIVGKMNGQIKRKSIQNSVVPLTAHIGSVVTIVCTWFVKNGEFVFDSNRIYDWVVLIICIYISISGVIIIIKSIKYPQFVIVNREELSCLVNVARDKARTSIINVSGNLSWLNDDYEAIQYIRQKNKYVNMKIYFNPHNISERILPQIIMLQDSGIEMIPYDIDKELSVKCMMTDIDNEEERKLFIYPKIENSKVVKIRDKDYFMWKQVDNDKFLLDSISSLIKIMGKRKKPFNVGISGINNIGKTHLFNKCIEILKGNFEIKGFDDEFKKYNTTDFNTNYIVLLNQIINQMYRSAEICFYDRTTIDNYCFMMTQNKPTKYQVDNLLVNLKNIVDNSMKNIDLIVYVQQINNDFSDTKHVTSENRRIINEQLHRNILTSNIKRMDVIISHENFEADIDSNANKIVEMVKRLYFAHNCI